MSKKLFSVVLLVSAILTLAGITAVWAEDPSQLIVIRGADDSIWKKTCVGSTCTDFTKVPGTFASPLTIVWDEVLKKYVAWGRAANGSIWKATFSASGSFDNNWVQVPGSTNYTPISVASSTLLRPILNGNTTGSIDANTIATCESYTNLSGPFGFTAPRNGFAYVTSSGIYAPGTANEYVRVCIGDSTGGICDSWDPVIESATVSGYTGEKMFSLQHWYYMNADDTITIALKGCKQSNSTTGTIMWNDFIVNFGVLP
jgi:hypothetical protein